MALESFRATTKLSLFGNKGTQSKGALSRSINEQGKLNGDTFRFNSFAAYQTAKNIDPSDNGLKISLRSMGM